MFKTFAYSIKNNKNKNNNKTYYKNDIFSEK